MFFHPTARGQSQDHQFIQAAGLAVIDILEHRIQSQMGLLESDPKLAVMTIRHLPVYQKPQPLLEPQAVQVPHLQLFGQGLGYSAEFERR